MVTIHHDPVRDPYQSQPGQREKLCPPDGSGDAGPSPHLQNPFGRHEWPGGVIWERCMDALDLARWQFAITTIYHFLFVPLTISLGFIVAGFQTAWYRSGDAKYLKLTRFYGELFLINFAMGVVTGIVQEFQFGMNWSDYSRYVGDIFGAPLAIEGLLAFFLESTFLGIWIFGWDKLPKRVHLASIWIIDRKSTRL